jgi:hypothetical protein
MAFYRQKGGRVHFFSQGETLGIKAILCTLGVQKAKKLLPRAFWVQGSPSLLHDIQHLLNLVLSFYPRYTPPDPSSSTDNDWHRGSWEQQQSRALKKAKGLAQTWNVPGIKIDVSSRGN